MARPGKDERKLRRTAEALSKELARGRAEEAADAFLSLPPAVRAAHREALARLVIPAVQKAFAARAWSTLDGWTRRVLAEPTLVAAPAGPEPVEAWWAMGWGAVHSARWADARRAFDRLAPALEGTSLGGALDELIRTEGRGEPARFAALAAEIAVPPDPRLGYEPPRQRPSAPRAPRSVDEVERAVLAAYGTRPHRELRELVGKWTDAADPEVARAIRLLAARLSVREVIGAGANVSASELDAARFVARCSLTLGAPPELAEAVSTAARAAFRGARGEPVDTRRLA